MKLAVVLLVGLGILAAGSAAVLMATLTSRADAVPAAALAEEEVEVLLASRDLSTMTVVDSSCLTSNKVPKSQVPEDALLNPVLVVGKVLTERMVVNQPFTRSCFAREGKGVYLAAAVPPGKRAMSISLTDWSGMAGLLYPGSVVDVLVSFKELGNAGRDQLEMKSTTLLQGLMVLAIGSQSIADGEYKDKNPGAMAQSGQMNHRMVTLLVDPKEAEILQLASQSGSIALAMRNPQDAAQEARRLTRASEIIPGRGVAAAAPTIPGDPFDNDAPKGEPVSTSAQNPLLDMLKQLGTSSRPDWETLIIRGNTSETRTFPMPDDDGAEPDAASSAAQ